MAINVYGIASSTNSWNMNRDGSANTMAFDDAQQSAWNGAQTQSDVKAGNPVTDAEQEARAQQMSDVLGLVQQLITQTVMHYVQLDANKVCLDESDMTATKVGQVKKLVNGCWQLENELTEIGC